MISIRKATEEDVQTLVALNHELFQEDAGQRDPQMNLNWALEEGEEYFEYMMMVNNSIGFLAESEGETVGYLVGRVKKRASFRPIRIAELESMFVYKPYRRLGVGKQLVDHFLAWTREWEVDRVTVTAYATNDPALNFYRKNGFVDRTISLELGL